MEINTEDVHNEGVKIKKKMGFFLVVDLWNSCMEFLSSSDRIEAQGKDSLAVLNVMSDGRPFLFKERIVGKAIKPAQHGY